MRAKDCLSATVLSKKTAATLDSLNRGDTDKFLILKNNTPRAVLMSIDAYEALKEEMEDLRLATLAFSRLKTFDLNKATSHKQMMEKYGQ